MQVIYLKVDFINFQEEMQFSFNLNFIYLIIMISEFDFKLIFILLYLWGDFIIILEDLNHCFNFIFINLIMIFNIFDIYINYIFILM